jgi:hypothetical protein
LYGEIVWVKLGAYRSVFMFVIIYIVAVIRLIGAEKYSIPKE